VDDLVIFGGGASGLSLGLLTGAQIVEASPHPGGHAVSTVDQGYTFDRGPHIMFSRSKFLLDCMVQSLGRNVHTCTRNNKVYLNGSLGKYPIENDLAAFGPEFASEALFDYVTGQTTIANNTNPKNLAEWFKTNFGAALTEKYFRPYNEKVWKTPLEELSMTWAERIPKPPIEDVIRGAVGVPTEGYLHQLFYQYPRIGGYSALMNSWARGLSDGHLLLNAPITRIRRLDAHLQYEVGGQSFKAAKIASTIPLANLVNLFEGTPQEIKQAVNRLRTNATVIVTLGFLGQDINQWTAVYVPEPEFLPNRLSWPAVFSPLNAPTGKFSVQAEIICPKLSDLSDLSDEMLVHHVHAGLLKRNLVPPDIELDVAFVERFELAYVVYTTGYERDVQLISDWYAKQGLHIHGRFGSHNYLNVDGCLAESIKLAKALGYPVAEHEVLRRFSSLGG